MSWSDNPGSVVTLFSSVGLLIRNRSKMLFSLVGFSTIWTRLNSFNMSMNSSYRDWS